MRNFLSKVATGWLGNVLLRQIKGDAMNLTLMFQNNMLVVGLRCSYNHVLFWCQRLPMDDNYFL